MAKLDNEIIAVEESNNEYAVNPYTIQYDAKTKRFFKGFAPKVGSGALISAGVFAGLGVATLLTGGLAGIGAGLVAGAVGASVGVGTAVQTMYSGIVYGRNSSRARFKALGIGGKEDNVGTIGIIEEYENRAHKYTKLLEANPDEKKFTLDDGRVYSRRDLKKRIKESEDIAYHGLKYILQQGTYISNNIETLRQKTNLTEYEENSLAKYWDMMDRIGLCVKNVASKRLNFNPYKGIIIDALQQSCLLGNYEQNNQIRAVATINEKEKAQELYFEMYERDLLERNKIKTPIQPQIDRREHEYIKQQNQTLSNQVEEMKKLNAGLGESLAKTQKGYKRNVATAWNKRAENKALKGQNEELTQQLGDANANLDKAKSALHKSRKANQAKQATIDQLEADLERALADWYEENTQYTHDIQEKDRIIKRLAKEKLSKQKAIDNLVIEREGLKAQNAGLKAENDGLNARLDEVVASYNELTKAFKEERISKAEYEKQVAQLEQQLTAINGNYKRAIHFANDKRKESRYWQKRAENAEDAVKAVYDGQTELEQQSKYWQDRAENAENAINGAYDTQAELEADVYRLQKELEAVTGENEIYKQGVDDLNEQLKLRDEVIENLEQVVDTIKGAQDMHDYNFEFGGAYYNLNRLIDKVDAHIEYTKENQPNYNKKVVKLLEGYVADLRAKNPAEMTIDEVKDFAKLLKNVHGSQKGDLENISSEKLDKLVKQIQQNRRNSKNNNLLTK